jgi:hypothetical protein
MLCNADDAMIQILGIVTSGMLQLSPLKEISSPRFKAIGYAMEKEICQNFFIFDFSIKQEVGGNHSIINIYVHKVHGIGYSFPSLEYTSYISVVVLKRSVELRKILHQVIFRFPRGFFFRVLAPLYLVPLGSCSSSNSISLI